MIVETEVQSIFQWLFLGAPAEGSSPGTMAAIWVFLITALVLGALGLLFSYLVSAFRNGPVRALFSMGRYMIQAPVDLLMISPRRVLGLSIHAAREALRRRIWIALVLYLIVLMFAGWILNPDSDEPAVLYLNFVLTATTYLMMPVAVFVSAFSLPNDIRNRTIYTIATKPVRSSEIVLGRILGFTAVTTVLLLIMGICSYIFVSRGLSHDHTLTASDLESVSDTSTSTAARYEGQTGLARRHRHVATVDVGRFLPELELAALPEGGVTVTSVRARSGEGGLAVGDRIVAIDDVAVEGISRDLAIRRLRGAAGTQVGLRVRRGDEELTVDVVRSVAEWTTEPNKGHKHRIVARRMDDGTTEGAIEYQLGPPEEMLTARVPRYGRLRFRDSRGDPSDRGISVGKIFAYRSYIRGNTLAAAIWNFNGLRSEDYPAGLPLDVNIRVYRSHMGNVEAGITGSIVVRNPDTNLRSKEQIFTGKDFTVDRIEIPRKLDDAKGQRIDLFKDLVTEDGRTEIWIRCMDPGQYFGMAPADVYLRAQDASYPFNFFKGFVGIWLQITLVTALAVLFSTFLSGPVAMLLTIASVILGFKKGQLGRIALGVLNPERMKEVASHERVYGGGPVEAFYRIITQDNLVSELDDGPLKNVIKNTDYVVMTCVDNLLHVLPNFEQFEEVQYLSHGYNIHGHLLLQHVSSTLAFVLAAYVIGYFLLKTRELAL